MRRKYPGSPGVVLWLAVIAAIIVCNVLYFKGLHDAGCHRKWWWAPSVWVCPK